MIVDTGARNNYADYLATRLNGGYIRFYTGTRPTGVTLQGGETLLASVQFGSPAFGAASNGVATANAITGDSAIDANGDAGFAVAYESDGTTPVANLSVGDANASNVDVNLANIGNTTLIAGNPLDVSSMTITAAAGD